MIRLYTTYYKDANPARHAEIAECLRKNLDNPLIDSIFLAVQNVDGINEDKIIVLETDNNPETLRVRRWTYQFFFDAINETAGPNDISILANSDIYFDGSVGLLTSVCSADVCVALSRWDIFADGTTQLCDKQDSQDAWAFRGKVRPINYGDFGLGLPGCDNRIAYELADAGYHVSNPALDVTASHLHISGTRRYSETGRIPRPYHLIPPHSI